jgi:hypothetical protein
MFGEGTDMAVKPRPIQATGTARSNTWFGFNYRCPVGAYGSAACANYFSGEGQYYQLADYEVFVITK